MDTTNLPALASFFPTPTHPDQIVDQYDQLHAAAPHLTNTANLAHHIDKQQALQDQIQKQAPAPLAAPAQAQGQPLPAPQTASAAPVAASPMNASLGSSTGGAGTGGLSPNPDQIPAPTQSLASPEALAPIPSQTEPQPLPVVQPDPDMIARQQERTRLIKPDTGLHNRENTGTSGINQIGNPWARVPLQILDALGRQMAPGIEPFIPGTQGHHNMLVNRADKEVATDQEMMSEQQKRQEEAAHQREEEAQPELQEARNQAAIYKAQVEAQWHKDMAEIGKEKADAARDDALWKLGINPRTGENIPLDQLPAKQRSEILLNQARANVANAQAELAEARAKGLPDEIKIKEQMLQVALQNFGLRQQANERQQQDFLIRDYGDYGPRGIPPGAPVTDQNQGVPARFAQYSQPTNATRTKAEAAGMVIEAGNSLKTLLADKNNQEVLGNLGSYLDQWFNNTPISDKRASNIIAALESYDALQAAAHGYRAGSVMFEFRKVVGGLPKNADAIMSAIDGIAGTMGTVQKAGTPRLSKGTGATNTGGGGTPPNVEHLEFDENGNLGPAKKK